MLRRDAPGGGSLPEGRANHYNRLRILRRLHSPLASNLIALLAAEREPLAAFATYLAETDPEDAEAKDWRPG